jgi:hypothetical protein
VRGKYMSRVMTAAESDPEVADRLLEVIQMVERPQTLFRPAVMRTVLGRTTASIPAQRDPVTAVVSG